MLLQRKWPELVANLPGTPQQTFALFSGALTAPKAGSRYITVAFLTHLVFAESIPIIDQHNFRAVNHLMGAVRLGWHGPAKPTRYEHIEWVKTFIDSVHKGWISRYPSEPLSSRAIDKFLMMYGKDLKRRSRKTLGGKSVEQPRVNG